jgi:Zn ribbon nucleic-acid-binding protein
MTTKYTLITSKTRKTFFGYKCPDCNKVIRLKGATWNTGEDFVTYKYSCQCGTSTQYLHGPAKVIKVGNDGIPSSPVDEIPF